MIDMLYELFGKVGFHEPLHAPMVHLPMGLAIGGFIFLAVAFVFKREKLALTARHVAILAFIFVFPTALAGVLDWLHFFRGAFLPPIIYKMVLTGVVMVGLGTAIIMGGNLTVRNFPLLIVYAVTVLAFIMIGFFGGRLVFAGWSAAGNATLLAAPTERTSEPAGEAADIAAGEKVFTANCAGCHPNGGNIVVVDLPLKNSRLLSDEKKFDAFVRKPVRRDGKPAQMPPFDEKALDAKQLDGVFDYIIATKKAWQ